MNLYDKSSLILVPGAVKDGKVYSQRPENGDGDFTFTRASSATRVNSSGLIEKGRENFLTHSNAFNNWTIDDVTMSSGQSGYDGSNNAWLIKYNTTASRHNINKTVTPQFSEIGAVSIYAKAKELQYIQLAFVNTTNQYANFDLSDGSIGDVGSDFFGAKAESVGNGWYRLSVANVRISNTLYISIISSKTAGWLQSFSGANNTDGLYIQDAQVEKGLLATDYIETTTTTAVSGITANTPRLDYSGGASCPSLLLEPTRTNLMPQSEPFSGGDWALFDNATIVSNFGTSPEGLQNAAKITSSGGNNDFIYDIISVTIGQEYTVSFFVKNINSAKTSWWGVNVADGDIFWNGSSIDYVTGPNVSYQDYGNGWYRIWQKSTATGSSQIIRFYSSRDGAGDVLLYGYQLEQATYPSSYIPTYGASVTRVDDYADNTDTINADNDFTFYFESTLMAEGFIDQYFDNPSGFAYLSGYAVGDQNLRHRYNNTNYAFTAPEGVFKYLIRKDSTNMKIYLNGVLEHTITTLPTGTNDLSIKNGIVHKTLLFPTALTDSECIALTTL